VTIGLWFAAAVVGAATAAAIVIGFALVDWADDVEQGWERDCYHESPTADPPVSHLGDDSDEP
jgi:hypothetical protein